MPVFTEVEQARRSIEKARENAPLAAPAVTLLAASKGQPEGLIQEAAMAGVKDFGENRVQEAETKWPSLRSSHPGLRLHLIGPLQTNKVKEALALFDVIQTLDRKKLADEIAACRVADARCQAYYIQVNTGEEPQKGGVVPDEADGFIDYCKKLGLPVVGLMCIPPVGQPPAPHFALLHSIAHRHGLRELSMGMSDDYETAVRMGSTCVRLGRALFGERA